MAKELLENEALKKMHDEGKKIIADRAEREAIEAEIEETAGDADLAEAELIRDTMRKTIHEAVIAAQGELATLANLVEAYQRKYSDPDGLCEIFKWVNSVKNTAAKPEKIAKENLWLKLNTGAGFTHTVGGYTITGSITPGKTTLDTDKIQEIDKAIYEYLIKLFPKKTSSSKRTNITKAGSKKKKGSL